MCAAFWDRTGCVSCRRAGESIACFFDAAMRDPDTTFAILHEMEQRGALSVRIYGSYVYAADGKDPIAAFKALKEKYHSEKLNLAMIKLFLDGTETNYTAYMLEPFADRPESRGAPLIAPAILNDLVQRIDAAGIDVHRHVVGDAAAREGLDALENAIRRIAVTRNSHLNTATWTVLLKECEANAGGRGTTHPAELCSYAMRPPTMVSSTRMLASVAAGVRSASRP